MSKKSSKKEEKEVFDSTNESLMTKLKKYMVNWFESNPGEEWISPKAFQNVFPVFDKYSSESFRAVFYNIKKKINGGEFELIQRELFL